MNDGSAIIKGNDVTTYNNEKVGTSFIVTTGGELSKRTLPFNDHGAVFTGIPLDNNQYLYGGYFNLKSESLRTSLGILDLNEPITGVEDAESHLITLYPNPVRDYLTLQVPDQASVYFSIYSLTGQQVAVPAIQSSGDLQVDVQALPPGMYVLKGTGRSGNFYKKFIKQ
ncbi:MAG: T9SS type A sorting domain-containing protein [Cyclobacteriaceae bacterium]